MYTEIFFFLQKQKKNNTNSSDVFPKNTKFDDLTRI